MRTHFLLNRLRFVLITIGLVAVSVLPACNSSSRVSIGAFLQENDGHPCFDWSAFTCVTLKIPLNHPAPDDGRRIEVTFAVLPAAKPELRKGILIIATGGPGSSGILSADYYTSGYDQAILDRFDIVFFDQRGLGLSGNLSCPQAAAAYYRPEMIPGSNQVENLKRNARIFTERCLQEMTGSELLPFLGTAQAMEDLEYFRKLTGDDKIWIYGESYGTQLAQLYAAIHPTRLAGLILDGTVDMTLPGLEYYRQQAQGFNDTLIAASGACETDPLCLRDLSFVSDASQPALQAIQVYDSLVQRLENSPQVYAFPLPDGSLVERTFTFGDLEFVAASQLYSEGDRMMFMRALLESSRGTTDIVPLARLLYLNLSLNPQTLAAIPDESYSDAVYYGVECQDYGYPGNSPEEKANNYIAAGDAILLPRFKSILYGDLPCAYWPYAVSDPARPAPVRAEGVPVLILGATADPVTPLGNGMNVFKHLSNGYLITTDGGPHVTFGYGNPCPDELVVDFLVDGKLPEARTTTCPGRVMDSYVPLAPDNAAWYTSIQEALTSFEIEMVYLPEFYYWNGYDPLRAGCPHGGTLHAERMENQIAVTLSHCGFTAGFQLTGSAIYDSENDMLTLDVTTSGNRACSRLDYTRTGDTINIEGYCDGGSVQNQTTWDDYQPWTLWKQQHPLLAAAGSP